MATIFATSETAAVQVDMEMEVEMNRDGPRRTQCKNFHPDRHVERRHKDQFPARRLGPLSARQLSASTRASRDAPIQLLSKSGGVLDFTLLIWMALTLFFNDFV